MKTLNYYLSVVFSLLVLGISSAQEKQSNVPTKETTFSVEINSKTTFDELKEVERMLKEDYNVNVLFEDVKMVNEEISSIRLQIKNDNQSLMKSIQNYNAPIDPFKIFLKEVDKGNYSVSIGEDSSKWSQAKSFFDEQNSFFQSDFRQLNERMNRIMQEAESSFNRYRSLFDELEKDPKAKKETINNADGSTTTIIQKSI